jgi:hypothetical protein
VPSDEQIEADLIVGASWLGQIYGLGDDGLYVPGNSPEVSDGIAALDAISRPRKKATPDASHGRREQGDRAACC